MKQFPAVGGAIYSGKARWVCVLEPSRPQTFPQDLIKPLGYVHRRQWRGRPRHEVRVPSHHRREHHKGNNNDCELTHALAVERNSWPECEELHRKGWPLLILKIPFELCSLVYRPRDARAANCF